MASKGKYPRYTKPIQPIYHIRFTKNPRRSLSRSSISFRLYPGLDKSYYATQRTLKILKIFRTPFEVLKTIYPEQLTMSLLLPAESLLYDPPPDDIVAEIIALASSRKDRLKPHQPAYAGRTAEKLQDSFVLDFPGGVRRYRWRWTKKTKRHKHPTLAQTFPKLIKAIKDPNTKLVVSLGSGGLRMFAHASIFKILEALGLKKHIEEIWGCSGGSIIGMVYSLGANPSLIEQEGYDLYQKKYDFQLNPSVADVLKNYFVNTFFPGGSLNVKGFVDIRNAMENSISRTAVHHKPLIPLFALAYNMNTKKNDVLTPSRVRTKIYGGEIKRCDTINSALASSAIPVLHVPRIIKRGKASFTYIDGSIYEEVPLISVYRKWLSDRKHRLTKKKLLIIAVDLFYFISTSRIFRNFPFNKLQILKLISEMMKLTDRSRAAKIKDQINTINSDPDAHAVSLTLPTLSKHNCLDPRIIPVAIDRAHATFFAQLLEIEKQLPSKL